MKRDGKCKIVQRKLREYKQSVSHEVVACQHAKWRESHLAGDAG